MESRASTRTRVSVIPVLIALVANFVALAPVGPGAGSVLASHVDPVFKAGNPTCGAFGDYDHEFRINAPASTTFSDPDSDFEVTLTLHNTAAGETMDFVANLPVDAVFVKGGDNGNLYTYDPPGPAVTSDSGLHAPVNPSNNTYFGISHVSFCFDDVPLLPALEIEKTPDSGIVNAGDPVSFTVTVTNTGDAAALNVDIDDTLPGGFAWTDNKAECSIAGTALHCDIATLTADASFSVTVTAPTDGTRCGEFPNVAFADADGVDQISDPGKVTVTCADIRIEKTPDGGNVEVGGAITFVLTVFNDGTGEARGVTVSDALDGSGWSIVVAETTLAGCLLTGSNLACGPDTIAGGGSKKVTVTRTAVFADDCGRIDNTATVDTTNDGDDSDTGFVTVLCADIEVDKSPDGAQVTAGDAATFSIVTSNAGNTTAVGVELGDDLPIVALGWTIVAAGTDWASCAIAGNAGEQQTLSCGPESIAAGGDLTVTVTTTATADDCGLLDNPAAEATTTNDGRDSDDGDITVLCPDVGIAKTGGDPVSAGEDASFTIVVTAGGTGTSTNVTVTDALIGDQEDWSVDHEDCSIDATPELLCTLGDLQPGDEVTITLTYTTDPDDCPEIANSATVSSDNDTDGSNDQAGPVTLTVNCADLEIEKSPDGAVVNAGDEISFTITVTNHGPGTATDVVLDDELPAGFDWAEDPDLAACSITEGDLHCDVGDLGDEASFSVTVSAPADAEDCGETAYVNTAVAGAANHAQVNDTGDVTIDCPDVTVDKEPVSSPVNAGEEGRFTIVVTNDGPGTAHDVELVDTAPEATLWTVLDDDGATCTDDVESGQQTITCDIGDLADGASVTILIGYTTTPNDCGTLDNAVAVTAANEPLSNTENNSDEASMVVECPFLNVTKVADEDMIDAGEEASFTITIWNSGPGDALDVTFHDELPAGLAWNFEVLSAHKFECGMASSQVPGGEEQMSIDCELGDLEPSSMADGVVIRVFADTDRTDCGALLNVATVDAGNLEGEALEASDTITVFCPIIALEKANDAVGSVLPGTEVTYTLTLTVDDETESVTDSVAEDVVVIDVMPVGLENPTDISDGGTFDADTRTIRWDLGDLPHGEYTLTYNAIVADDVENGEDLVNAAAATSPNSQCPDLEALGPECEDDSVVIPRVPTLVIDKVADVEVITITGPANAPVATPSVVTWTLTYTLENGPVTNAVITDEVPEGLEYVAGSASDGGAFDEATNTITWTFPTLTESGSVTFQTTVDPETISRIAPTVNVAVIGSDETAPDDGEDSITVRVIPPPQTGNPTPGASLPDTSTGLSPTGQPVNVPIELLSFVFIASMGALTLANVRARNRRR